MKNSTIESFRGEYNWLSNFCYFNKPMLYDGMSFPTNEHFYIAMKTLCKEKRLEVANHPAKGLKAFGRSLVIRDDWEGIKLDVMLFGLRYKFSNSNPALRDKLIATGDMYIQEGNYWNDKFWGYCLKTREGENNLGKLLMQVRNEIKEKHYDKW